MICRMAGNILGPLLQQVNESRAPIDIYGMNEVVGLAVDTAMTIVETVDERLAEETEE